MQGLNLINSTNLDYFQPQHQAEMINLKAQFFAALGDTLGTQPCEQDARWGQSIPTVGTPLGESTSWLQGAGGTKAATVASKVGAVHPDSGARQQQSSEARASLNRVFFRT